VIVVHICGVIGLTAIFHGDTAAAIMAGSAKFVLADFGKVLLAASLVKLGRESWLRWLAPEMTPKI
jgi:biotin transporter BioY